MRCAACPLFTSWNNESDRGEACGLFFAAKKEEEGEE